MSIDLSNSGTGHNDIRCHIGHDLAAVGYGYDPEENAFANTAIECETCGVVLIDFDNPLAPMTAGGQGGTVEDHKDCRIVTMHTEDMVAECDYTDGVMLVDLDNEECVESTEREFYCDDHQVPLRPVAWESVN